jgi:hypothetical protein
VAPTAITSSELTPAGTGNVYVPAPVYVHVTVEPDCEQPAGSAARGDAASATPHNPAKPADANNNATTQPPTSANNKPNLHAPRTNIANNPNPAKPF